MNHSRERERGVGQARKQESQTPHPGPLPGREGGPSDRQDRPYIYYKLIQHPNRRSVVSTLCV